MVDISGKIADIFKMVKRGDYFVINRPRQYGKTTTLSMLNQFLQATPEFLPISISFEGIGEVAFKSEDSFVRKLLSRLRKSFVASGYQDLVASINSISSPFDLEDLDSWVSDLVIKTGKKVVLMIDEVDKSSNNQLFLDFLGMLRNKYLNRKKPGQLTFHSVILAGVHDVKSLKLKLRPESEAKLNSPWNIAVNFEVNLSFTAGEIGSMLDEYAKAEQVMMDIPFFAEKLFYLTSGYPFLVSLLCNIIHEKILPVKDNHNEWQIEDLEKAVQITLNKDNTNFEDVIKNLENNPDLYEFVFQIIMNGSEFTYNPDNLLIYFGVMFGILKNENGKVRVHNRIYEQRIYNYMASKLETSGKIPFDHFTSHYLDNSGRLDIPKVFLKFRDFMKENYSEKDQSFLERNGRLLFLAFIKPIINGRGFDFKEVQISEERRLDIVITFDNRKYIIELKIWRGEAYHREGIRQLSGYLEGQNETSGYLLIYDLRKESGFIGKNETVRIDGKTIFAAWV